MKKKILALFAVILAAIGLVGVAKVSAETVTRQYYYNFNDWDGKTTSVEAKDVTDSTKTISISIDSTQVEQKTNVYTSKTIYPNSENNDVTFKKYIRITGKTSQAMSFSPKGNYSIKLQYAVETAGKTIKVNDDTKTFSAVVGKTLYTKELTGLSGAASISRNGSSCWIFEMLITVEESNSTYYNVNYYDEDKETELCESVPVESGKTTTVPKNISFSKVGKKFKAWVDSDGKEFDFETQITTNTNLYATYEEDSSYSVTNKNAITSSLISAIYNEQITKVSGELEITNTNYALSNIEEIASANIKIGKISSSSYLKLNAESKGVLNVVANNGSTTAISKVALFASDKQTVVSTIEIAAGASDSHELIFNISETGTYYLSLTSDSTGSAIRATSIEFVPFNALTLVQDGHRTVDDNVIYSYRFVSIIDGVSSVSDLEAYTFEITYTDENGTSTTKKCSQVRIVDEIQNSDGTVYEQTIVGSDNSSTKYTFSQNATRKYVLYSIAYKDNSRNYTGTLTFTIKLGENVISTKEVSWK